MLGVVVLADLFVIVLFALCSAAAKAALGIAGGARIAVGHIAWACSARSWPGSSSPRPSPPTCAGSAAARRSSSSPRRSWSRRSASGSGSTLLVSLTAGVLVRNLTALGDELHERVEGASLPVYVIFFAVTGAKLHLAAVPPVAIPVLAIVAARAASLLAAGRAGARLAGAPPEVARWAPYGLLPQAGVALALALLFARLPRVRQRGLRGGARRRRDERDRRPRRVPARAVAERRGRARPRAPDARARVPGSAGDRVRLSAATAALLWGYAARRGRRAGDWRRKAPARSARSAGDGTHRELRRHGAPVTDRAARSYLPLHH